MFEGRFHSFLARTPLPVATLNSQSRFVEMNTAMSEIVGTRGEMHAERTLGELFPDLAATVDPILEQVLATGVPIQSEIAIPWPNGQEATRHWLVSWIPIVEHSEIVMLGVEVTEQKGTHEALKRARVELAAKAAELDQIATIDEMGQLLDAAMTEAEVFHIIEGLMSRFFPRAGGALCLTNAVQSAVEVVAAWGNGPVCELVFTPSDCWALREGRTYHVSEPDSGVPCAHALDAGSARLCIPMAAQMQTLGVLHLRRIEEGPFTQAELVLANKITEKIALALENLKLPDAFRCQAMCDPLTGLYNRRYFQASMNRELRRAARKGLPLGIVIVDVDRFKQFNDSAGHDGGDFLLRNLGATVAAQVRLEDITCRFGGDQFSIIFPDTSLDSLVRRAEELCQAIRQFTTPWRGKTLSGITSSIGVAVFPDHGSNADELMKAADDALYRAKAAGGDRVKTSAPRRGYHRELLDRALRGQQDFFAAESAGNVLARFGTFGLRVCSNGFSNAALDLRPDSSVSAHPIEIADEIAEGLTPNITGLERDLLRKSLNETVLQAAGLGQRLDSVDVASGIEEFLARYGVNSLLELFLSTYVFDVLCFKIGDFVLGRARNERSVKASLLRLERLCKQVVRLSLQNLRLDIALYRLSKDARLSQTVIRTIEAALRNEGKPDRLSIPKTNVAALRWFRGR